MAAITTVEHATNRSVYEATHQHPTPNIRLHNASLFAIALFHTHTHTAAHSRGNDMAINGVWLEFNSGECHSIIRASAAAKKEQKTTISLRSKEATSKYALLYFDETKKIAAMSFTGVFTFGFELQHATFERHTKTEIAIQQKETFFSRFFAFSSDYPFLLWHFNLNRQ